MFGRPQGSLQALAISFIIGTAAEFVAAKSGIGYLTWTFWELLKVDAMFVGIVTIGLLGVITSTIFLEVDRVVIPCKSNQPARCNFPVDSWLTGVKR